MRKLRALLVLALVGFGPIVAVAAPAQATVITMSAQQAQSIIAEAAASGEQIAYTPVENGTVKIARMMVGDSLGCAAGVGCIFSGYSGGGTKKTIAIGSFHANQCWNLTHPPEPVPNNTASSATADYGSGYDLGLWDFADCNWSGGAIAISGGCGCWLNFAGSSAWFDNKTTSFMIADLVA